MFLVSMYVAIVISFFLLTHLKCIVTGTREKVVPRGVKGHRIDSSTVSYAFTYTCMSGKKMDIVVNINTHQSSVEAIC